MIRGATSFAALMLFIAAPAPGEPASECGSCSTWGSPQACRICADWNAPRELFRVYGNTYYVGVSGLSSILITSNDGHVLIDGDLPESPPHIVAGIRQLGFRIEDVKLILNTHVHFDHAGGIAELQRQSGATVAASERSAKVLREGVAGPDDPQYGTLPPTPAVSQVTIVKDGETLRVGPLSLTAHLTPGHTRGGTSWSWKSCEDERCVDVVYADSLTAVSAANFLFTRNADYSDVLKDFERSFATLSALPCDILLSAHPEVSGTWDKLEWRQRGDEPQAFVDPTSCRKYVDGARIRLQQRVTQESVAPTP